MRSRSITLKLPWPIYDAMLEICQEEKYDSMNACITGALVEKILIMRRRKWIRDMAHLKPKKQDYLLDKMISFPMDLDEAAEYFKRAEGK